MWHRCSLPYMLTALLHGTKSLQVCRFQPEHSMLQDYQSCLPEYKLTTIKLSVQCSVLKHRHCRVLLCVVNTASCALCRMSTDSIFNIVPASLTLGAVLARGSPGITLYKADLLLGQRTLQVQLLTGFSACLP